MFTQLCCVTSLPTTVKNLAVVNCVLAVANMVVFAGGMIEYWTDDCFNLNQICREENQKKNDVAKRYVRPVLWISYYCFWGLQIYLGILLHGAAKRSNTKCCKRWIWIQACSLACFVALYSVHSAWLKWHNVVLGVVFGIFSFYLVYLIWVVHYFMKWVERNHPDIQRALSQLSDEDVEEFYNGNAAGRSTKRRRQIRYNPSLEINRNSLNARNTWIPIAATQFSKVYKAYCHQEGKAKKIVAVKTIQSELEAFKAQLCEFKIRTEIEPHENIVALIGANTSNIRNRELQLVLEYCEHGSLEDFLEGIKLKGLFVNQLDSSGKINPSRVRVSRTSLNAFLTITCPLQATKTVDLVYWAYDVAKGMRHLHQMKVIHADVATRNVLLGADLIAKINDFGSSKQCFSGEYVQSKLELLPWQLMAPECFDAKIRVSYKSDVWAYGVLLYEMFTLGKSPYSNIDFNERDERTYFVYGLKDGKVNPGRPKYAPEEIYTLMQSCWTVNPKRRPNFEEIVEKLEKNLDSLLTESRANDRAPKRVSTVSATVSATGVVDVSENSELTQTAANNSQGNVGNITSAARVTSPYVQAAAIFSPNTSQSYARVTLGDLAGCSGLNATVMPTLEVVSEKPVPREKSQYKSVELIMNASGSEATKRNNDK